MRNIYCRKCFGPNPVKIFKEFKTKRLVKCIDCKFKGYQAVFSFSRYRKENFTHKEAVKISKKYKEVSKFKKEQYSLYCWASRNGLINDLCSNMKRKIVHKVKITIRIPNIDNIFKVIENVSSLKELREDFNYTYATCLKLGLDMKQLFDVKDDLNTLNRFKEEARKTALVKFLE